MVVSGKPQTSKAFAACHRKNCYIIVYYQIMSAYGELNPMPEDRTQFPFKGKR